MAYLVNLIINVFACNIYLAITGDVQLQLGVVWIIYTKILCLNAHVTSGPC